MHLEGIPLAPAGSIKDMVMRKVFFDRKLQNLRSNILKILPQGESNKDSFTKIYKEYLNAELNISSEDITKSEKQMREEYALLAKTAPVLSMGDGGKLQVTGI